MAIKILKLISSEDIIGDYEERDSESITIIKPAKLVMYPTDDGGVAIAIIPWAPFSDDKDIPIRKDCIIASMYPSDEIKNEYNERFGNGIVTPRSGGIIA